MMVRDVAANAHDKARNHPEKAIEPTCFFAGKKKTNLLLQIVRFIPILFVLQSKSDKIKQVLRTVETYH